ncbi:unnamed protein product [Rotaria socialis]
MVIKKKPSEAKSIKFKAFHLTVLTIAQMSQNVWDTARDEIDRTRPPVISQVYDGSYLAGKTVGEALNNVIETAEKKSPLTASAARIARAYAEDQLPMFQDNRNKKN